MILPWTSCSPTASVMAEERRIVGRRVIEMSVVGSTNDVASGLAFAGAEEGTVVVAEEQTAGRGRRGAKWISPPGVNLYVSVVLRPGAATRHAGGLAFVGAVAVAEFLRSEYALDARVKWPNDILCGGRKIAGVLVEAQATGAGIMETAILGVGLNVNWTEIAAEIRDEATSIAVELGRSVDRSSCLNGLLASLDEVYAEYLEHGLDPVLARWRKLDCTAGSRVLALCEDGASVAGTAVDITPYGALIVETAAGERRVLHAADVRITDMSF